MQSQYHQWVVLQALCSALMNPHPQWAVKFALCCLQVSGNHEGSSAYYLVLMRMNEQWAVSQRLIMRCGFLPDISLWEMAHDLLFMWGRSRYPISCCFQACFRFCSACWPRLSHFEEVKLIVSVINLISHHLLKGFTACQALRQVLGNRIEWDEHLITSHSYQSLKHRCTGRASTHSRWGNEGTSGHHRAADNNQSISNIPVVTG